MRQVTFKVLAAELGRGVLGAPPVRLLSTTRPRVAALAGTDLARAALRVALDRESLYTNPPNEAKASIALVADVMLALAEALREQAQELRNGSAPR